MHCNTAAETRCYLVMRTDFVFDVRPLTIATFDLGTWKYELSSAMSSLLALPSTGCIGGRGGAADSTEERSCLSPPEPPNLPD